MINENTYRLGAKRSVIREIFEYGNRRAAEIGKENVFDFSLGNPSVPAPQAVQDKLLELVKNTDPAILHAYSSAQGHYSVRKEICDSYNARYGTALKPELFYMTVGAAASLCITFQALACKDDELIVFAPYFPEYSVFSEGAGLKMRVVPAQKPDFQIDFAAFELLLNERTKAVLINSPNNPSGTVYSKQTLQRLGSILREAEARFGHPIYLISDEPYRDLVYGEPVPCVFDFYDDTVLCYSYSKSISLPGERIGYIAVSERAADCEALYLSVCGAARSLGYVCAPTLFQFLIAQCANECVDLSVYEKNRNLLYGVLNECGFECARPDGAFYIFMKAPDGDASALCERAKKYELLLVPGDGFGCEGYVRISYCVQTEMLERALPAFKKLAEEYRG